MKQIITIKNNLKKDIDLENDSLSDDEEKDYDENLIVSSKENLTDIEDNISNK